MFNQILELFHISDFKSIKLLLAEMNRVDIAEFFEFVAFGPEDSMILITVFRMLQKDTAAEVFSYLDKDIQKLIIESITEKEISEIVNALFLDDTIDFIEEMPSNIVKKVLKNTTASRRELLNEFLNYPKDSAGSIMTIEFVELKASMAIGDALMKIRKNGVNKETIYTCYVISPSRRLEGSVDLKTLLIENDDILVGDIMDMNPIYVDTTEDREMVANTFRKYSLSAMPVVDSEHCLVGIITVDDVIHVMQEEATQDFEKMSAMSPSEKPYLKTNVFLLAKNRIIWLLALMLSATLTGSIMGRFENLLSSMVVLATFVPLIMSTGGNAGSQSSTLIIRGMALGEVDAKNILKVIWKEFRVALIAGGILAIFNFLRLIFMNYLSSYISIDYVPLSVAAVVSVSIFITIMIAKIIGCTLPILAKKLRLDPAIMATPLITTIVDSTSLAIYFSIAAAFLNI